MSLEMNRFFDSTKEGFLMHLFFRLLGLVLILVALAGPSWAQSVYDKLSPGTRAEVEKLSAADRAQLRAGGASDNDFLCSRWGCVGGDLRLGFDDWKPIGQGDYWSNFGSSIGLEAASPIPGLQDHGIGAQVATSFGVYNWNGRDSSPPRDSMTRQEMFSAGLFRRPDPFGSAWSRWGLGFVYDISGNRSADSRTDTYTIAQWRVQASFYLTPSQEIGVWTAWRDNSSTMAGISPFGGAPAVDTYAATDQLNFFYKYSFASGGHVRVYMGPGVGGSITQNLATNFTGFFIPGMGPHAFRATMGADAVAPINERFALYGATSYGLPDVSPMRSPQASVLNAWMVSTGIRFYWGANVRVHEDSGRRWMPYLSAPDNGNFITQTNYID